MHIDLINLLELVLVTILLVWRLIGSNKKPMRTEQSAIFESELQLHPPGQAKSPILNTHYIL